MNFPPAEPPPAPSPIPDQDADLATELDAILAVLDEPADEECGEQPDDDAGDLGPDPLGHDWITCLGSGAAAGTAAGFGDGGALDGLEPGAALAGFSQTVLDDGLGTLSDDELTGVLRASRRLAAWQDGVEMIAVAELDRRRQAGRPVCSAVDDEVSAELAAALVLTGRSADALMGLARDLVRLPAVRNALLEGRIDLARARIFAEEVAGLPDAAAAAAAARLIARAGTMTTSRLRVALKALVLSIDPAAARTRAQRGKDQARVEAWQEHSGNCGLAGRELPAADALAADSRLTAIAHALKDSGAPGTMDQLRAAVLIALLVGRDPESLLPPRPDASQRGNDDHGCGPDGPGGPGAPDRPDGHDGPAGSDSSGTGPAGPGGPDGPGGLAALSGTVHLIMPAAAWLGLSDAPGEAAGLGPIDAWACRDLAARLAAGGSQTRWHVTLTSPDGRAVATAAARAGPEPPYRAWLAGLTFDWLERGTCAHPRQVLRYQPGRRLRNLVCARQRTCSFPGCRRPAARSDLDHTLAYDQGGRTCECNLSPLCRRHHKTKQAPGWHLAQPEPGVLVWTAPHGRSYTVTPEPYLT